MRYEMWNFFLVRHFKISKEVDKWIREFCVMQDAVHARRL